MSYNRNYGKPENALKRADELVHVGHKDAAIQVLRDVLLSRRYRGWQASLEDVCIKYLDLCIQDRKARLGKDGLYQFRNICQPSNLSSLEKAIRYFLDESERRAALAKEEAAVAAEAINASEEEVSAESKWLLALSGEDVADRNDRATIHPWLKFLWEAYRTTLDLLKSNAKLEHLYHEAAHRGMAFCVRYDRKTDFRRLCETLRIHLSNLIKYQHQVHQNVNINTHGTLQMHLETRFRQLQASIEMELWQESFKTLEDVHQLLLMSKSAPAPQHLAKFYSQLSVVFWISEEPLYHAFALWLFFKISKSQNKGFTAENVRQYACRVIIAALAVPASDKKDQHDIFDDDLQKNLHIASLLGYNYPLSREMLFAELKSNDVLSFADPEFRALFTTLEVNFQPLELCSKADPLIEALAQKEDFAKYRKWLRRNAFFTSLQQVQRVFQTVSFAKLLAATPFYDRDTVERLLAVSIKKGAVDARFDLQHDTIKFGSEVFEASHVRKQLVAFGQKVKEAVSIVRPTNEERAKQKALLFGDSQKLQEQLKAEHRGIMLRKQVIEQRKLKAEQLEQQKQKEREAEERARRQRQLEQKEEQKQVTEQWEQDLKKRIDVQIAVQANRPAVRPPWAEQASKQAFGLATNAPMKKEEDAPVVVPGLAVETEVTLQDKIKEQQEEAARIIKEKEELAAKLQNIAKTLRFTERACRNAEIPLLEEWYQNYKQTGQQQHDERIARERDLHQKRHEFQLSEKHRQERMQSHRSAFEKIFLERRKARYEVEKAAQDERQADLRAEIAREKKKIEEIEKKNEAQRLAAEERRNKAREEKEREIQLIEERRLAAEAKKMEERKRMQEGRGSPAQAAPVATAAADEPPARSGRWADSEARAPVDPRDSRDSRDEGRYEPSREEPRREEGGSKWGGSRRDDGPEREEGGSKWGRGGGGSKWSARREEGGSKWSARREEGGSKWGGGGRRDDGPREERGGFSDRGSGGGGRYDRGSGDGYSDRGSGDRYSDRGGDRYSGRGGDRYSDRGGGAGDRYSDRGSDRYSDRGGDRYSDRGGDRYSADRGGERESKWGRGGARGESKWSQRRNNSSSGGSEPAKESDDGFTVVSRKR